MTTSADQQKRLDVLLTRWADRLAGLRESIARPNPSVDVEHCKLLAYAYDTCLRELTDAVGEP